MSSRSRRTGRRALAVLGWLVGFASPPAAAEPPRLAVLPLVVHSTADHEVLREGLADMLAARLGRALPVVRIADPARATRDADAARAAAREVAADYVLFGSFTRFGEGASLDVHCVSVTGDDARDGRSVFIQSGTLAGIIPGLDGLADKLVHHVTGRAPRAVEAGERDALEQAHTEIEALRKRVAELEAALGDSASGVEP